MMQVDSFASESEVAMWLCAPLLVGLWSSLGLVPDYVVLVLGNLVLVVGNEGEVLIICKVVIHKAYG